MSRAPIGRRIRERRRDRQMTQTALAEAVGISASYLNLIEHDKRQIGGTLLRRIAEALALEVDALSGIEDARLAQDIVEIARSLAVGPAETDGAMDFVARCPDWAQSFVRLHRSYRDAADTVLALGDRLSQDPALMELSHAVLTQVTTIRSFAEILEQHGDLAPEERARFSHIIAEQSDQLGISAREMVTLLGGTVDTARPSSPAEEVDDFIIHHGNHFPELEAAAEELRAALTAGGAEIGAAVEARLADGAEPAAPADAEADAAPLPEPTRRFRAARRLVSAALGDLLDATVEDARLTSPEARARGRAAMVSYAAGAILFPYAPFLEAAERLRYDVDALAARFHGSFEQAAHRLVTLRRPGAEGVPFAFLRADPAGNLSKPFSVPGLRMPRFGGSCPLWALHGAFARADGPVAQLAVTPEGERFLFVARRVAKRVGRYGAPPVVFSVMLGCEAAYADRLVYGDAFAGGRDTLATPVGFNCRSCPRADCAQRAHPAIAGARVRPAAAERTEPQTVD